MESVLFHLSGILAHQDGFATSVFTAFRWRTDESDDTIPYSHHGYAYALGDPILLTDPTGRCSRTGDDYCFPTRRGPGENQPPRTTPGPGPIPPTPPQTPTPPRPQPSYGGPNLGSGSDCIAGAFKQVAYNTTMTLARDAAPQPGETVAMTVCRQVGNVGSILQGIGEGIAGGGAALGGIALCGTVVLCIAGAPAAIGGAVLAAHGASQVVLGAWQLVSTAVTVCSGSGGGSPVLSPTPGITPGPTPVPQPTPASLPDVAQARQQLGLPPRSTNPDDGFTVAILRVDNREIWGMNGSKPISFPVNAISKTHAEIDALDQLAQIRQVSGVRGGRAIMTVDRIPCPACYPNGGIRSGVRAAGLDELEVIYPGGQIIIKP